MTTTTNKRSARSDLVVFGESVLGLKYWSKQKQILRAIKKHRQVAVRACHSSGKTFLSASAALGFACQHDNSRVITLAPGWMTTRSVVWNQIHSQVQGAPYRLPTVATTQTEIKFGPNNLIIGLSTNESTRLQGHHAEHVLLIADEATGIEPDFWPSIQGILASGDSHLLILGNPTVSSGFFFDAFTRNRAAWDTHTISAFDTPNLAGLSLEDLLKLPDDQLDVNSHPYLTTRRWVRERYNEWFNGTIENSPLWQSRVLGEFPSSSSNALVPLALLEAARRPPSDSNERVIVGVDPAGPGRDRTTAVACAGGSILDIGVWTDADARGPVLQFLKKWADRLKLVRVDSAGLGFYFCEHIRSSGFAAEGINVATSAADKERFANSKAARYWFLRERFQRGEISGLSDEMLAELAAVSYAVDAAGRITIDGKADVKSILGRSPDLAEALMIALGEHPPGPVGYMPAPYQPPRAVWDPSAETNRLYARGEDVARAEDMAAITSKARWGRGWGKNF